MLGARYLSSPLPLDHSFKKYIYIFYLFGCTRSQLRHMGSSSLTRDRTRDPAVGAQSLTGPPWKSSASLYAPAGPGPSRPGCQGRRGCRERWAWEEQGQTEDAQWTSLPAGWTAAPCLPGKQNRASVQIPGFKVRGRPRWKEPW